MSLSISILSAERILVFFHLVEGDNIHVIRVPEPGDGELRGLLVPVGADAPHAPDRQMVPHDDIYADSDDDAHTQRPGIAAVVTSRPIDTPSSRPIATPSSVSVTAERSLSEGADSGLGKLTIFNKQIRLKSKTTC